MRVFNESTNEAYSDIIELLSEEPVQESRAGGTKEHLMVAVHSENPRDRVMLRPGINWAFGLQEAYAYWMGKNPGHVERYNSNMENYMTDGELEGSAYGRYLRHIPHDQIERVKGQLRENQDTRQAVINFHQAGVENYDGPDVACTIYLQFIIRDNELHCTANLRSQDMLYGYPYDVHAFQWLQEVLAGHLELKLGSYTHIMNSCHYYTEHEDEVLTAVDEMTDYVNRDIRRFEPLHLFVMSELKYGLRDIRHGVDPKLTIEALRKRAPFYADWLRTMQVYEAHRFHDDLVKPITIKTDWMHDWLESIGAL